MEELREDFSSYKMQAAYDFIKSVLLKEYPSNEVISMLFNGQEKNIIKSVEWFWNNPDLVLGRRLRTKKYDPKEIFMARYEIENNPLIIDLDFYVHTQQDPPRNLMEKVYGEFADDVISVYRYYNEAGLERESGIPASTHPHNLAMTGYSMNFSTIGVAALAYHDVPEDLYNFLVNKYNLPSGIEGYDNFMEVMIPEKIRMHVNSITNKYDTIIETIGYSLKNLKNNGKELKFNKENVLEAIIPLLEKDNGSMGIYLMRTYSIANALTDSSDFRDKLKWACYRDYIEDIADNCKANNNFLAFDMKGIDLFFNGIGRESVKRESKIKNALKQMTWVNKGYQIQTNYMPLNNHIMEIAENALSFAKDFVARDLIKSIYKTSFLYRAYKNMKQLTPIFFEDVDTDYKLTE
ncbi:MAG: hypothetical protein KatS3mg002_0086 [Candidatus Woesearchaeota archaeon]|nr:MAG: hypothetical protein KatS3mg002_0086 [Candidatus Woesearchaeota archaeon]